MANTAAENLSREIEDLKKDMSRLQKDLYSKMESAGTCGREKIMMYKDKLRDAIESLREQLSVKANSAYENIKEQGTLAMDKGRQTIGEKPLTAILIAFCAGAVLGVFTNKLKSKS